MEPFLDELLQAGAIDKGFRARMDAIEDLAGADPEQAMELLEETPESIRTTGLFRVRYGSVLAALGKYDEALGDLTRTLPLLADGCRGIR